MNALHELMDKLDEIKEHLKDEEYLEITDLTKKIHHHILKEETMTYLSTRVNCYEHGIFCMCDADQRVQYAMNDLAKLPRYLRTIAEIMADQHGL